MKLQELSELARKLANELFNTDEAPCCRLTSKEPQSCLALEDIRPLTRQEKAQGWVRRPFWAYNPQKLCMGCQAYWHTERAAQQLQELLSWQAWTKARQASDGDRGNSWIS